MKCHSKRLESRGAACRVGSGWLESSVASLRMRFMVGDLVLKVGRAMIVEGLTRILVGILRQVSERGSPEMHCVIRGFHGCDMGQADFIR